jgi:predicted SnoaL-like aldol condensation-catalyzing enzyme
MNEAEHANKALVIEAFDTLFNRRDYAAAQRLWSPHYIQHSAHIEPGREGLFDLIKTMPPDLSYKNQLVVADGDYVMLHGRFSQIGQPANWIVTDIVRVADGLLAEHWNVIQDEVTRSQSKSAHRHLLSRRRLRQRFAPRALSRCWVPVTWKDRWGEHRNGVVQGPPVSGGDHQSLRVAVLSVLAELS